MRIPREECYGQASLATEATTEVFLLQILEHSPWLQTRPLFLLALHQPDASSPLTYTLRTRVQRKGAEDELSKVRILVAGSLGG